MDAIDTVQLLTALFVIGIVAEAVAAALSAGQQRMDLFGVIALAALTALGGGTIRDILLDSYPLTWVEEPIYLIIVVIAAIITVSLSFLMHHFRRLFLLMDAIGLATFSVLGTQVALGLGHGFVIACVAAVVNGVSGGVLRDLMSDRVPLVFSKELYASIAILATTIYIGLLELGLPENWVIMITLTVTFVVRVIAMFFGMSLPVFDYQDKEPSVRPRLGLSYGRLRRGMRTARRRTFLDSSRYSLLEDRRDAQDRLQAWESHDEPDDEPDGVAEPVSDLR
ncbi:trimeric intracellular cation channel family protein [Corynebacterium alimapuense]|uniref:Trimeric intracellular cation channel family protein n=1 Tax=Corynebacterium alimapuense TaxID=1576874 RepID=A0A3M8K8C8_9CORY|nr:trimeric intracellular cation channel family protein [Corynebacterium alimapuense]RNE48802.1 trimeric intracellular cation channel family protein [Corynebacterium alimapuense]